VTIRPLEEVGRDSTPLEEVGRDSRALEEVGRGSTALEEVGRDSRALEEVGRDSTSRNDSLVIRNSVEHARDAILCRLELENGSDVPAPREVKFVDTIRM
jgi:hypothetical protein